jgi:hypothetical protein
MHRISRSTILVIILLVGSLVPTVVVAIPAMVDYPNHLARMHILAAAGTPEENPFYTVRWRAYPNLAMDVIVPWLGRRGLSRMRSPMRVRHRLDFHPCAGPSLCNAGGFNAPTTSRAFHQAQARLWHVEFSPALIGFLTYSCHNQHLLA